MSRRYGIAQRKTANAVGKKRQRELGPSLLRPSNVEMRPPFCALEGSDVFKNMRLLLPCLKQPQAIYTCMYLTFHSASYYMTHTVVKVQRR